MLGSVRPRLLVACKADVGEGPVYDHSGDALFWVDIPAGHLWRWDRKSGDVAFREVGEPLGSVALIEGGGFLLATRSGVQILPHWSATPALWQPVEPDLATQFNDGKCDPQGRFVAGTAAPGGGVTGTLYRVDHDGAVHPLFGDIGMSNGLDWSPDGRFFYHVDTLAQTVRRYRWDGAAGVALDPEPFIEVPPSDGLPDGLAVDSEGSLWLAVWGAGEVRRYGPDGGALGALTLPTPNVSSCAFGGPDGTELFITTAAQATPSHGEEARFAGDLFVASAPVRGQRPRTFPRHGIPPELWARS